MCLWKVSCISLFSKFVGPEPPHPRPGRQSRDWVLASSWWWWPDFDIFLGWHFVLSVLKILFQRHDKVRKIKFIASYVRTTKDKCMKICHLCHRLFFKGRTAWGFGPCLPPLPSRWLCCCSWCSQTHRFCAFPTYVYTLNNKQCVWCLKISQLVSLFMLICVACVEVCCTSLFIRSLHRSVSKHAICFSKLWDRSMS